MDLWSLGCIIFLFFHGTTPFKEKTNKLIFNKIENIEYFMDEGLNEDIRDLISKLLVRNPLERLGAGTTENKRDFGALKNHKFFKGIDWENLGSTTPPIPAKKLLLNYKLKNNSTDNLLEFSSSIGISKSAKKSVSKINKIISQDILIDKDNNIKEDYMKNIYGEEIKYENDYFYNNEIANKDISEELETIKKNNEIRKSIKIQELQKDEVVYEG